MSLARQFGLEKPVTGNVTTRAQEKKPVATPVTVVTITRAEHDSLKAEVEKLRAEVAELRAMIERPATKSEKRDRAAYMREYRKRTKKGPSNDE